MKKFKVIRKTLLSISYWVGGSTMILMTILVTAEVVTRNVFKFGLPFSVEYTEYLVPVLTFVGAAYTMKEGAFVKVDIFIKFVPTTIAKIISLAGHILGLLFLIIIMKYTLKLALVSIERNYVSLYPLETPIGYIQVIIPIGIILLSIEMVFEIIEKVNDLKTK